MENESSSVNKAEGLSLVKEAVRMAWPAVCESFFIALAGLVDTYMVSGLSSNAVAAVGLTTQPKFLGMSLFIAMNVSVSALVARRRGEKKQRNANQILITALTLCVLAVIAISGLSVFFANEIIEFCGSTVETHAMAVAYFRIIMGGLVFNAVSMCINAAQRGSGNTVIAMRTNLISNAVNVMGNYLLIEGRWGFPALGIEGAALATVFGTVVACVISIVSLFKKDGFVSVSYIVTEKIRPVKLAFVNIVKVGYSVFIEQILMRIGFMSTAMMAADMGMVPMAAHQVGMNFMGLTFSFGDGMQVAAVALIGRSLGERLPDKAKAYGSICRKIGMGISIALAGFYFFFGESLYRLFFAEEEIVAVGISIIRVIIFIVLFQVSQVIYMGCLRGAGDTAYTAFASTISVTIIRTGVSFLCGYIFDWGMTGIWLGILADQIARYLFASIRFRMGKWIHIKI